MVVCRHPVGWVFGEGSKGGKEFSSLKALWPKKKKTEKETGREKKRQTSAA